MKEIEGYMRQLNQKEDSGAPNHKMLTRDRRMGEVFHSMFPRSRDKTQNHNGVISGSNGSQERVAT